MHIQTGARVGAWFTCNVYRADGTLKCSSGKSKNMVLDSGLAQMGKSTSWSSALHVGTGLGDTVATMTELVNKVATTTTHVNPRIVRDISDPSKPFYKCTRTSRFAKGAAQGNLTELAIGWGTKECWNRSLIRDAQGEPTTLTILADEYLEVLTEVRIYPTVESTSQVNLVDKLGATISTHTLRTRVFMTPTFPDDWNNGEIRINLRGYSEDGGMIVNAAMTEDLSSYPESPKIVEGNNFRGATTYPSATVAQSIKAIPLDAANGSHRLIIMGIQNLLVFGSLGYKTEITPPITKQSVATMSYTFRFTWGRL